MKYKVEMWTIRKLCRLINKKIINLSPPYQRNDIWSTAAQGKLIESINQGWPLPNFFVLKTAEGFEMVDGQQRSRAILAHTKSPGMKAPQNALNAKEFLDYKINVAVISDLYPARDSIEEYYARVNSTGLRLNRPELDKAKYYDTAFLALVQTLAQHPTLRELAIFSESGVDRMNDVDLVAELLTGLQYGTTDKKTKVTEMFENDVDRAASIQLEARFERVIGIFGELNRVFPLRNTRYKQRNDFYSLFLIFDSLASNDFSIPKYFYRILIRLDAFISPSQEHCEPLKEYAICCVTQSNSKSARDTRQAILKGLLMNEGAQVNEIQQAVLAMFGLPMTATTMVDRYLVLDAAQIEAARPEPQ